jgi:hypothetical protein
MASRRGNKTKKVIKRWCVMVVFKDGTEVILSDKARFADARHRLETLTGRQLYQNHDYHLELRELEFEDTDDLY